MRTELQRDEQAGPDKYKHAGSDMGMELKNEHAGSRDTEQVGSEVTGCTCSSLFVLLLI